MSPQAVTVRLQRLSQLRALCLSLAAAGRRAGLAPHPAGSTPEPHAGQQGADSARSGPADSQTHLANQALPNEANPAGRRRRRAPPSAPGRPCRSWNGCAEQAQVSPACDGANRLVARPLADSVTVLTE